MGCGADVARGTRADATRHARPRGRATRAMQRVGGAQVRTSGANAWQGPRESTRMPEWPHVAGGLEGEGPTG